MQPWPKRLSLSYPTPPFLSHSLDASATVITSGRGPNGHREMASPATRILDDSCQTGPIDYKSFVTTCIIACGNKANISPLDFPLFFSTCSVKENEHSVVHTAASDMVIMPSVPPVGFILTRRDKSDRCQWADSLHFSSGL